MNKYIKISLITAGILFAVGIVLAGIASVAGGERLMEEFRDGQLSWIIKNMNASTYFKNISHEHFTIDIAGEDVTELDLMLGAGSFSVYQKAEADGKIDVECTRRGKFDAYVKNGTLYVEGFKKIKVNNNYNEAIILIPKGMAFHHVNVEAGAGRVEIYEINADTLEAEIGAGELILDNVSVEDVALEVGIGQFSGSNIKAVNVDISVSMGESFFSGSISGELDAECNMGNMAFELQGKETDHNYQVECSAGNINFGGHSYTGLGVERSINNGVSSNFDIECNMGNIDIYFTE